MKSQAAVFASILCLSLFSTLAAEEAFAGPVVKRTPHAYGRQVRQNKRINRGVRNGTLDNSEAQSLRSEQQGIQQQKLDARSDGVVTREERRALSQSQNTASQDIYSAKTN